MKRLICIVTILILAIPFTSEAQGLKQDVLIRSHGRLYPGGKQTSGEPITGALVTVEGLSGTIMSGDDGGLTFGIPSGYYYSLSSIYKDGHTLTDYSIISDRHYHSKEPLKVYMENVQAMEQYRYVISMQIRGEYHKKIQELQSELDRLRREGKTTQEELQRLQSEISRAWQESENVIEDITERYLLIDFDEESDEDIAFHTHILNGDIESAKRMVYSPEEIERKAREVRIGQTAINNLREDVSRHCLRMCDIYKYEFKHDSVAYFLELCASVDRTNIKWQIEAARYIKDFLGDYDRALNIYEPMLEYCKEHYGELHEKTAALYSNIGLVYDNQGDYDNALEYYNKAKEIQEKILPNDNLNLAYTYLVIAGAYFQTQDFGNALIYLEKSLVGLEKHDKAFAEEIKSMIEQLTGIIDNK